MGWAKFDDQFTDHPKVVAAGPMAELLAMRAVIYCARYETDGHVQAAQLPRLTVGITSPKKQVRALVDAGLWTVDDDGDGWWVHDFLDYHPSRADKDEERAKARERMAKARGNKGRGSPGSSSDVRANTQPNVGRSSDNPVPDPSPTPEQDQPTTSDLRPDADDPPDEPDVSDDARRLTRRFAEAVKANGHAIPTTGSKARDDWLIEMDRLLRIGPPGEGGHIPDPDEVARVIDWCSSDHGNGSYPGESVVLRSVPKLRKRWSELRAKANGQARASPNGRTVDDHHVTGRF